MTRCRVRRSSLTLRSRASGICYGCLSRIIRSRADACEACELMCLLETARNCFHTFCSHRSLVFFPCSLCTQICNFANFLCLWKLLPDAVPPPHLCAGVGGRARRRRSHGLRGNFQHLASRHLCDAYIIDGVCPSLWKRRARIYWIAVFWSL